MRSIKKAPLRFRIGIVLSRISHITISFRQAFGFKTTSSCSTWAFYNKPTDNLPVSISPFKSHKTPHNAHHGRFVSFQVIPYGSSRIGSSNGPGDTCRTTAYPIPTPYLCDNLVLRARACPIPLTHSLRFPPLPPHWHFKSSKFFPQISACFCHSDSALHCCHPLLSPSNLLPIVCHSSPHTVPRFVFSSCSGILSSHH